MSQRRPHSFRRVRPARGMTLLEVVLAVMILGLIAAAVSSGLAFVYGQERQEDLKLAAYEIANRLILQYLDDETVIQQMNGQPLQYGTSRFQWELTVQKFNMIMKEPDPGTSHARPQYKDRFEVVTVKVWLHSDDARGRLAGLEQGPEPLAELRRLLDPGAVRNSDAMTRLGQDPNRLMSLVTRMGITPPDQSQAQNQGRFGSRHGTNDRGAPAPRR